MKRLSLVICLFAIKTTLCADSKPPISQETKTTIGQKASPGQFPWEAALFFEKGPSSEFWFCSGSIISSQWILTAAHCVKDAESVFIYTGIVDISQQIQPIAISKEFIIHEKFTSESFLSDIALIKVPKELKFDDETQTIPLSTDKVESGTTVTISAWSVTNTNGTKVNANMTYVNLEILSDNECQKLLNSGVSSSEIICTISEPVLGDNGGPVIANFDTGANLVGIVTLVSYKGDEGGTVVGYTKIEPYLDWIKEKTGVKKDN